jgi:hypothetical protein
MKRNRRRGGWVRCMSRRDWQLLGAIFAAFVMALAFAAAVNAHVALR